MRIALVSRAFYPSLGGLETITRELAESWAATGHEVRVLTLVGLGDYPELGTITVVRRPGLGTLLEEIATCDVVVQSGISLRSMWLPLMLRKPMVVIHHALLNPNERGLRLRHAAKRWASRLTNNVAVSAAVGKNLLGRVVVIPNAFRPPAADVRHAGPRSGVVFVGRLVSEKGCDVAIEAIARLHAGGLPLELTICGDGPERGSLERLVHERGLQRHVHFLGRIDDWATLSRAYRAAAVAVMPSRNEPFGIVALEAVAAGCVPVASRVGGLPEAVGPCGILVGPDDAGGLADGVRRALLDEVRAPLLAAAPDHLGAHSIDRVSRRYLGLFREVLCPERGSADSSHTSAW